MQKPPSLSRQSILAGLAVTSAAVAACLCACVAERRQARRTGMFGCLADTWQVARFEHAYMQGTDARFCGHPEESCRLPRSLRRQAWLAGWHEEDLIQSDFSP